jgi:hypothetical protein
MSEYNIANNKQYKWTTVNGSYLEEVPRIYAKSYLIKNNDVVATVKRWADLEKLQGGTKYYDSLHDTSGSEQDRWIFPFFNDDVRQTSTSWGDTYVGSTNGTQSFGANTAGAIKDIASTVGTTIGQVAAIASGKPGALFEPPKYFDYANLGEAAVTIEFGLINTLNDDDYNSNYKLISRLIEINKLSRQGANIVEPAAIWEVTVPGYRKIRWASADVNVKLMGQRKIVDQKIIPEGYRVAITFKSLYTEPREYKSQYTDQLQ